VVVRAWLVCATVTQVRGSPHSVLQDLAAGRQVPDLRCASLRKKMRDRNQYRPPQDLKPN
jgi:hypothetical protein